MTDFPPPYDLLPVSLQDTIRRTHREKNGNNANFGWQLGFKGVHNRMTIPELLKAMEARGDLQVIKNVHARCVAALPKLWDGVRNILGVWDYLGGANVSQGFDMTCDDPNALQALVKASTHFCEDPVNVHGPRDTYRELIKSGPGLHVCITQKDSRGDEHPHGIHIDKFQTVCERKSDGKCDYKLTKNTFMHMKDATPWWLGDKLRKLDYTPALKPGEPKL
jgi:hypothetical protein